MNRFLTNCFILKLSINTTVLNTDVLFVSDTFFTGTSFRTLSFLFRMAHNTTASLVYKTCKAIWDEFNMDHKPFPTEEIFLKISEEFFTQWDFPHSIGCIDGKHIRIKCPPHSGPCLLYTSRCV